MYCSACGNKLNPEDQFCNKCGERIGQDQSSKNAKKKGKGKTALIVILIILLIGALGVAVYFYLAGNKSKETLQQPVLFPVQGTYASAQTVYVSTLDKNVTIYYTTDGTDPTTSSTKYDAAKGIPVSATTLLKSIAIDNEGNSSNITSALYVIDTGNTPGVSLKSLTSMVSSSWDVSKDAMSAFTASASSTLKASNKINYYASNVLDSNKDTAWIEGAKGWGIDESIVLTYNGKDNRSFSKMHILTGYCKSEETFNSNCVPVKLYVIYKKGSNDVGIANVTLSATSSPQIVDFGEAITLSRGDSIIIQIKDAVCVKSDDSKDTAITEIALQ